MIKIFAISGSLRGQSSNTNVLRAVTLLASEGVSISLYEGLGILPHFNPDLEGKEDLAVLDFRRRLQESHAVLISSPEYAHGVPGVLKNALDWIVGSGELVDKPVALINASPRSTHANESLTETITVMSARLVKDACVTLPLGDKTLDAQAIACHPSISPLLREVLAKLVGAINSRRS